jgi:hypothetical protein
VVFVAPVIWQTRIEREPRGALAAMVKLSSFVGMTLGTAACGGVADGTEASHVGPTETRSALRLPGRSKPHPHKSAALPVTDLEEEKEEEGRNLKAGHGQRRQYH